MSWGGQAGELRRRIREARQLREPVVPGVTHEIVGYVVHRFPPGEHSPALGVQQRHRNLVVGCLRSPEPGGSPAGEVIAVHERPVALGRCPGTHEIHRAAGSIGDHRGAERARLRDEVPGIGIAVLRTPIDDLPRCGGAANQPGPDPAALPPELPEERPAVRQPGHARIPELQVGQRRRFAGEGRRQRAYPVAALGGLLRIAPVQRLGPTQGRGLALDPVHAADTGRDGVEVRRHRILQWQVRQLPRHPAVGGPDGDPQRKPAHRNRVGPGAVPLQHQNPAAIGRWRGRVVEAWRADGLDAAIQADHGQLTPCEILELRLVGRVLQQILVGAVRPGPALRFLDRRTGRDGIGGRSDASAHWDHRTEKRTPIGHPAAGGAEDRVERAGREEPRRAGGHLAHPQRDSAITRHREGEAAPVRCPERKAQPGSLRRGDRSRLAPGHGHQAVGGIPRNPARAVAPRIQPQARQAELRCGDLGDGRQGGALDQEQRCAVRAHADRWQGRSIQDPRDRLRSIVIRLLGCEDRGNGEQYRKDAHGWPGPWGQVKNASRSGGVNHTVIRHGRRGGELPDS